MSSQFKLKGTIPVYSKFWVAVAYIITCVIYISLLFLLAYEEEKQKWYFSGLFMALIIVFCYFIYWRWISKSIFSSNLAYNQKICND
ncbi:Uncharacterized protein CTYZ_00000277 [Cryptosporidium tyzzeri]|uniref:Uncharacterized protein n=1 Tax=Cryptosporidium parvum TaxID=5807 RepID=A0A7S7LDH5_CRYPV|nr:Uncharacterized protein CPATCC_0002670 [Cryptosporidium parvum]TRY49947.1 Uncharacterized protein CTYZ_00000277 [Cryptosporidium tyzzeri]WRK34010.1 Uncharacterized protein cpbgf_8002553 [Cryptosporidium parvum]|eukprot:QOY40012.1 hypothetical protein CPATCC_004081 [Cryptosporidium parvum]